MLKASSNSSGPVATIIADIHSEGAKFDRELRSNHREKITLPVDVICRQSEITHGFTRNISPQGLCIISLENFPHTERATLCLYRLDEKPTRVLAECRWSRAYGHRYWISGWQFNGLPRS